MPDKEFPRTPTLRFFHRGRNLVIEARHDGVTKIERADIPEAIGALLAVALAENIPASDILRCAYAATALVKAKESV